MASLPVNSITSEPGQVIPWSTGLCNCFSECFLSCALSAVVYVIMHHFTGCCLSFTYASYYRQKFRHQYGLQASPCPDICVHCVCHYCALCQEHRELRNQGFDMIIGWRANVLRQNSGLMMAPMAEGGMQR